MGHSYNDRTRVSAALLSTSDGNVNLAAGTNTYTGFFTASQAFDAGKLGAQRVGFYAMVGSAPVSFLTSGGAPIPGTGSMSKSFHREGFVGLFYLGKLDFQVVTQHGWDNVWFGQGYGNAINPSNGSPGQGTSPPTYGLNCVPGACTFPATARAPTWNGYMVETHYVYSPQLIFIQRSEWERVSQQALTTNPSNMGNLDMYTFGYRYYPIMTSRAGFAFHNEYSWVREKGMAPDGSDLTSSSLFLGFDFDF
jgi:hypothetical protein